MQLGTSSYDLLVVGTGPLSRALVDYLKQDIAHRAIGFIEDAAFQKNKFVDGLPVFTTEALSTTHSADKTRLMLGAGYRGVNKYRKELCERLAAQGYEYCGYRHPAASIAPSAEVAPTAHIFAGAVVEPFASIGDHTCLWANTVVAHNSSVGEFSWLAAGAAIGGQARIGDRVFLGMNSTVINDVTVGDGSFIGSAAHITRLVGAEEVHLAASAIKHRFSAEDFARMSGF